jgi:SAM-dependent methyltransferase
MSVISRRAWYKEWFNTPFYHKLYFERDEKEAKEFIQKLIHFLEAKPGSRVLDAACGRGRHSIVLADMGFDVTGIDLSLNSINWAKQFEKDNLQFFVHDMRLPCWINYFDFAFNLFTSFGYFATRREHDDAIHSIAASLKPGGVFVIDYLNSHFAEERLVRDETKNISGTSYDIHRWDDEKFFYKRIRIEDATLTTPMEFTEQVNKFSFGDFNDMLAYQGMQVMEVFGDYNLDPYDVKKTPRLIIVARKKAVNEIVEKEKRLYGDGRRTDPLS